MSRLTPSTVEDELILTVQENDDDSLTLEWDHTHPRAIELGINDWTEEEWRKCLEESALAALEDEFDEDPEDE